MGAVWLHQLPDIMRNAGLTFDVWPGWETRSRSSGGYDRVLAVGTHHDAGTAGSSLQSRCSYAWERASSRPIGALWLHTDATVMIGAAGATNTQGKGGPYQTSRGTIPLDQGNRFMLSIEASNNGVGEVWPTAMQDAYVTLCAALVDEFDLLPSDVIAHFEWTSRKIDQAGNSRYATGGNRWDMNRFRADVDRARQQPSPPIPPPTAQEVRMFDINVIREGWPGPVTLNVSDRNTRWIANGNTVALDRAAGVPQLPTDGRTWITKDQLLGLLIDRPGSGPSPFASGAFADADIQAMWS